MEIKNTINEFQSQLHLIFGLNFTKIWKNVFKTNSSEQINAFLDSEKTKRRIKKLKHYNEDLYYFIHEQLEKAVLDNDINRTKKLIEVGLDVNINAHLFSHFIKNATRLKSKEILPMLSILVEGGLKIYHENYEKYHTSAIHNILEAIELYKYHNFDRQINYLSKSEDEKYMKINSLFSSLMILKEKIQTVNLHENENLVYLALKTKSQMVIKEIIDMPCITHEYIQKALEKIEDDESSKVLDEILVVSEKKLLEIQLADNSKDNIKKFAKI